MINVRQTMYKQRDIHTREKKQCTNCFCPVFSFLFQSIDTVELYTHNLDFHPVDHFECKSQHEPKPKEN